MTDPSPQGRRNAASAVSTTPARVAITGASGMVGTALRGALAARGIDAVGISRRPGPGDVAWNPAEGTIDRDALHGVSAVIHLAGENLAGGRWTDVRKRALRDSRLQGTTLIARTVATLVPQPGVLISASAVGLYGDRGEEPLDETSAPADTFLARLVRDWERAADPAREAGIRTVHPRFGMIVSPEGGALEKMLPTARLGLGGPLGGGRQWFPWVALDDVLAVILRALDDGTMAGAYNVVAPGQLRQREFAAALGRVLHRPAVAPVPAFVLRALFGEMADATLLTSARVAPARLREAEFVFRWPDAEEALREYCGGGERRR